VGAYVPAWNDQKVAKTVTAGEFDKYVGDAATASGLDVSKPFVFTVEGVFSKVSFHVINGACPIHARMRKIKLPPVAPAVDFRAGPYFPCSMAGTRRAHNVSSRSLGSPGSVNITLIFCLWNCSS
jgi:hypothetical protein